MPSASNSKENTSILLVEDEGIVALDLQRRLQKQGFRVIDITDNGPDALRLADETSPSLILMDIVIQGDMDGVDTALELRKRHDIPVVFLTAHSDQATIQRARSAMPYGYLIKPFEERELMTTIDMAVYRHQSEARIREQAALLDLVQDAIVMCDSEDHIQYWSKGAQRIHGWTAEEAIGRNAVEMLFGEEQPDLHAARRQALEFGEWSGEFKQVTKDGRSILMESRWTLLRDAGGKPKSMLWAGTDVTQKREIEARLLHTQRLDSIGTLASGVAHDLNNVLTPILMGIDLLKMRLTDESLQRFLAGMEKSAKHGAGVVSQILTFARGVDGERSVVALPTLIADQVQICRGTFPKVIEIQSTTPQDLWSVHGDSTQLHQVLMNLCINARDAMANGGMLTIDAANVIVDEDSAKMHPGTSGGPFALFTVADTGTGIPKAVKEKMFDPFFTTKDVGKGTGLGLSTALGIVRNHGGFVEVETEEGRGSRFSVYLPAAPGSEASARSAPEADSLRGDGECILLVDDEKMISDIGANILKNHGYRVLTAADGTQAVMIFAKAQTEIAAVITDMSMPYMDGFATIRALKAMRDDLPVVAMSGMMDKAKAAELQGLPNVTFLQKPFTTAKLLGRLREALAGVAVAR